MDSGVKTFINGVEYDYPGMFCDDPVDYDNCASNIVLGGCVAPFCNHDCIEGTCVDTGTLKGATDLNADDGTYPDGFYCDCRAVGKYGVDRGAGKLKIEKQFKLEFLILKKVIMAEKSKNVKI